MSLENFLIQLLNSVQYGLTAAIVTNRLDLAIEGIAVGVIRNDRAF